MPGNPAGALCSMKPKVLPPQFEGHLPSEAATAAVLAHSHSIHRARLACADIARESAVA
jgi:hypothetical protein